MKNEPGIKEPLSQSEGDQAFIDFEWFWQRFPQVKVVLLDQTALAIKEGHFFDAPLIVGMRKVELTAETARTIEQFLPKCEKTDKGYMGEISKVPVEIRIIKGKYSFIENPDTIAWRGENYFIPNSWSEYWEVRDTIE